MYIIIEEGVKNYPVKAVKSDTFLLWETCVGYSSVSFTTMSISIYKELNLSINVYRLLRLIAKAYFFIYLFLASCKEQPWD